MKSTRRDFFKHSAIAGAALSIPTVWTGASAVAQRRRWGRDRMKLAAIGVGGSRGAYSQGTAVAMRASQFANMIAVCDVDDVHMDEFDAKFDKKLKKYQDYRELLEKEKPEVVTIGTPDHWHVPIAIAALRGRLRRVLRKAAHAHDRRRLPHSRRRERDRPHVPSRHAAAERARSLVPEGDRHRPERPAGQEGQRRYRDRRRRGRRPVSRIPKCPAASIGTCGLAPRTRRTTPRNAAKASVGTTTTRAAR